ncbi:hypothetical protein Kpho02_77490 [Kitasatospora phosalacinea]|uniref:Uncharacterized protein n=1 Tax=Kitasatospora phosalacinea TaxID=2065 RepID=A0A9W6V7N9_9ACTN|nr:hypothetical protein [Kitasatospora phosalacinea]GLW75452.1 hypothetical protein Kpho02_77490 [Kitasatospora phosalacinea]
MGEVEQRAAARRRVQRQARGLAAEQIGAHLVAARDWERHSGRDEYAGPGPAWEVQEWERISALVAEGGAGAVYDVAADEQAQEWLAEAEQRVQAGRRARQQRPVPGPLRPPVDRVEVRVVVPGEAGRRLEALAAGLGWSAERVLAVLAEHVQVDNEGLVHVPAVTVTAAPPGPEPHRERLPVLYRERPRYGREDYGEGYDGPALDW